MGNDKFRIAVVAPGKRLEEEAAQRLTAFAAENFPNIALTIHPQCFMTHGHFAGPDESRASALIETANDDSFDAIWWARGGYGTNRIAERVLAKLNDAAKRKIWLGYSDAGFLLAGLYRAGFPFVAHGPVAMDICRDRGEAAIARALSFLTARDPQTLEPHIANSPEPHAAFNLTILSHLIGTHLMPDLTDHVLMVEDVSEHHYQLDRKFFHVLNALPGLRGLYLGRVSDIPENDIPFEADEDQIARHWCYQTGTPYLGRADIGHDADNRIVPFGTWPWPETSPES
jgi:muramoyltetrapeptide carboxypeptidase